MPDEIQPPKTIPEMGIHLMYMAKAQNTMQSTLEKILTDSVSRIDFDEHVLWGDKQVEDINGRLRTVEKSIDLDNLSLMGRVSRSLDKKIVGLIVFVLSATFIYAAYMIVQNNLNTTKAPEVQVIDNGKN